MSSGFHHYICEEFLGEFFPDPEDKAAIAAGMEQLRAEQHAWRLAEMRRPGASAGLCARMRMSAAAGMIVT